MIEGNIGQMIIGNFYGWEDLKIGDKSGLDVRKKDNSIIAEIKNNYNTCNSGSKKAVLDKLALYKKNNPDTRCVLGIINPKPNSKNLTKTLIHQGEEIEIIQGMELFKVVFNINGIDYSNLVLNHIKRKMNQMYKLL